MEKKYIIAFEVSGSQIKGVLASISTREDGTPGIPRIEAIEVQEQKSCVNYGRVQNVGETTIHVNKIIEKLKSHPEIAGADIKTCYVGNAGRSLMSERVTTSIDFPVTTEIVPEMRDTLISEAIKQIPLGKEILGVIPRRFIVDNHVYPTAVGVLGRNLKGEFTIIKCNPDNAQNLQMVFRDKVKLPISKFIVTPVAVADITLTNDEKQLGCVLVDMGAQTTTVSIYKDNALQYLATLPIGSHNITRDLTIGLKYTEEKAESAKYQSDVLAETQRTGENIQRINSFVQARANEIIANIIAQVKFGNFKLEELGAGFILTGRGSKLRNFDKLLAENSRLRVRKAKITAQIEFDRQDASIDPLDYLSVIAIAANAASDPDSVNCVEIKKPKKVLELPNIPTPQVKDVTSSFNTGNGKYRTVIDTDDDGDDWMKDRTGKEQQKAETKPAQKPETKIIQEEPKKPETKKKTMLERIQEKMKGLFETNEDLGDADL